MRRALLSLMLIVSVALSPIGGLAHAYQHFDGGTGNPTHGKHESGAPCGLCAAYGALEHAAAGQLAPPVILRTAIAPSAEGTRGITPRPFLHYFQRGPPTDL
ncbi:MAG: DUF2946 family protein [Burkholderiales bacterium]